MADDEGTDPLIARLECGELAFRFREAAHVEFTAASKALDKYSGQLSKIENGDVAPPPDVVEKMITLYGLGEPEADQLRQASILARRRADATPVPQSSRKYVSLERLASTIKMVYPEWPGLLENFEFALAALERSLSVPAKEVPAMAAARPKRGAEVIHAGGPKVQIVLGEEALYREFGGPGVLLNQLVYFRDEFLRLPEVEFRVATYDVGGVPALSCPFTLLHFDPRKPTDRLEKIAYTVSLSRTDYIKQTAPYEAAFDQAWALAKNEEESAAILDRRIANLEQQLGA
ncbi:helix-turn-helix domain-containing protein [Lentzea sp. NEAU-D7]|uniref:helix-turn-helix domain-containing protein n=1 Tax=Lentzea sp. NEAU-D7 TaxID=2994667 RepID=UPI00224B963A|nr:helix-turn-helix transcriptional regulator [Lentzea sp. NEAU-D7]MCX2949975.1 helix-turn-helix transcriptional regulator [Lentzea sp. NEAU-D7]